MEDAPLDRVDPLVPRPPADPRPFDRLHDLVDRLRDDPRAGVVALAVVALLAGLVWYRAASGPGGGVAAQAGPATTAPMPTPTTGAGIVFVHVAGAVVTPGLYELGPTSRVADAIDAAGGVAANADPDRLNLAARLTDGQRVYVPRVGEPSPPEPPGASGGANAGDMHAGPVNLNTATAAQLEALPGIGPSLAQAIVTERAKRPFRSVDDLLRVRGIGEARLAELRSHVTV